MRHCSERSCGLRPLQPCDHGSSNFWVAIFHHWEAICPRGPVGRDPCSNCAPQPQTTEHERECRALFRHVVTQCGRNVQQLAQARPNPLVMQTGVFESYVRADHSEKTGGARAGTTKLTANRHQWDTLQKSGLVLRQLGSNERRVADWSSENLHPSTLDGNL